MNKKRDPLVVTIPDVLGKVAEAAEKDPDFFGKNAERLQARIEKAEKLQYDGHLGPLDQDLRSMTYGRLEAEVVKLRAGIRAHRDADGHNLCWFVPELWNLLPEKVTPKPKVPPQGEFLSNCKVYRASLKTRT